MEARVYTLIDILFNIKAPHNFLCGTLFIKLKNISRKIEYILLIKKEEKYERE